MYCTMHIQNPVYYREFRHIQACSRPIQTYCGIFRTLCNSFIFRTLPYSEFAIFRILAYLGPEAYLESCLYRHIQAYSGILNNDSYNNINFLFFTLILHTFQPNLKELRNRILRTILVGSLFCLIRLYVGLHFLQFLLEN